MEEFNRVKRRIMVQHTPGSGDNLEGMLVDLQHSLEQSRLLTGVQVRKTGDLDCMIEASCRPAAQTLTISAVAAEIERLWLEELRYPQFEAHAIRRADYQVCLDFITASGHGGYYVTGRIAADVSQIEGPIKTVTFQYRLTGRGWSEATLCDGVATVTLTASYLSDTLGDLVRAVVALLEGAPRSACSWDEEPGEHRWLLERRGEDLRIDILWFEDTFSRLLDERGKPIFSTECRLHPFALRIRDELKRLLTEHGEAGYREIWVSHDFPLPELAMLDGLLSGDGSLSKEV